MSPCAMTLTTPPSYDPSACSAALALIGSGLAIEPTAAAGRDQRDVTAGALQGAAAREEIAGRGDVDVTEAGRGVARRHLIDRRARGQAQVHAWRCRPAPRASRAPTRPWSALP